MGLKLYCFSVELLSADPTMRAQWGHNGTTNLIVSLHKPHFLPLKLFIVVVFPVSLVLVLVLSQGSNIE